MLLTAGKFQSGCLFGLRATVLISIIPELVNGKSCMYFIVQKHGFPGLLQPIPYIVIDIHGGW